MDIQKYEEEREGFESFRDRISYDLDDAVKREVEDAGEEFSPMDMNLPVECFLDEEIKTPITQALPSFYGFSFSDLNNQVENDTNISYNTTTNNNNNNNNEMSPKQMMVLTTFPNDNEQEDDMNIYKVDPSSQMNDYLLNLENDKTESDSESIIEMKPFVETVPRKPMYHYIQYYYNWNKLTFKMNASYGQISDRELVLLHRKRLKQNKNEQIAMGNIKNPLVKLINNFLYLMMLGQFLGYNNTFKLMFLCKKIYCIFHAYLSLNVNLDPFQQTMQYMITFLKNHKEFSFRILNTYLNKHFLDTTAAGELMKSMEQLWFSGKDYPYNIENEDVNDSMLEIYMFGPRQDRFEMKTCDMILNRIGGCRVSSINMRTIFALNEYKNAYLRKFHRGDVFFSRSKKSFQHITNRSSGDYFKEIYPYGNKVCTYEYRVRLQKHIKRRWNMRTNYVHENYFEHTPNNENDKRNGILKMVENEHSFLYPCNTSFLSLNESGYINVWTINDMNSITPVCVAKSQLTYNDKNIEPVDILSLGSDHFLLADENNVYDFFLCEESNNNITEMQLMFEIPESRKSYRIKNMVISDSDSMVVGLNKAICYRVNMELQKEESYKLLNENLQKIQNFDMNTCIVLTEKRILVDDRRMPKYIEHINLEDINTFYTIKDAIQEGMNPQIDRFCCCDLTGINLVTLNSNQSAFLFDLRYPFPTSTLCFERVVNTFETRKMQQKLNFLKNLKTFYNTRGYLENKRYSGFHDNIILTPKVLQESKDPKVDEHKKVCNGKKEETKKKQDYYVRNKIYSDDNFIYTVVNDNWKNKMKSYTSMINIWRWTERRQMKSLFPYRETYNSKKTLYEENNFYETNPINEVYKFVDAPNHLFLTYENSNSIHLVLPPLHRMDIRTGLREISPILYPTNL